jgi:hypothetical protein
MKFLHLGPTAILTFSIITFGILMLFEFTLTDSKGTRFYYVISQCKTCEAASALAKRDFEKGSYFLIRWGLPETISVVTGEVLESYYKVEQMYGGCVGRDEVDCYTDTMYSLLQQKYGLEFYFQARKKASRICSERKKANPLY